jgi:hypothetical protein
MNDLDELLREFAPEAADDRAQRVAEAAVRRQLRHAITDGAAARAPRARRRRLPGRLVLAGALAVAVVAVVALLPGSHAGETGPSPATAAVVLERVARVATRQPAAPQPNAHQFLYLKLLEANTSGVALGPWKGPLKTPFANYQTRDVKQDWVRTNGTGRERIVALAAPRFLTSRDQALARAHNAQPSPLPSVDGVYHQRGIYYANPVGLPTEPDALLRAIERRFDHGRPTTEQTFAAIGQLLLDSSSPALRAALYRLIAAQPGVQLLGAETDPVGHRGVAVGLTDVITGIRSVIVFDPRTSDVLEEAIVQAAKARRGPLTPVGTPLGYTVFIRRGVVNRIDALPGGGRLPLCAPAPARRGAGGATCSG